MHFQIFRFPSTIQPGRLLHKIIPSVSFPYNHISRGALSLYLESLQVRREIVTEFGRSPESLRDVFVSHGKLSILYADAGEKETACEQLAKCGEVLEEIQQRGWADAQTITDRQWFDAFKDDLGCPGAP